jgi:hypothetical protein
MTSRPILRHRAQLACGGVIAVVAIAGCGSSSTTSTSASAGGSGPGAAASGAGPGGAGRTQLSAKVTACLKEHGVTFGGGFGGHRPGGAPTGATGAGGPPTGGTGAGGPPAGATGKSGRPRFSGHPGGAGFAGSSKVRAALKACGVGASSGNGSPGA